MNKKAVSVLVGIAFVVLAFYVFSINEGERNNNGNLKEEITISNFNYTYQSWIPGNSGALDTKMMEFKFEGRKILLVSRNGYRNRSIVNDYPGENVSQGEEIKYGEGKYGFHFSEINSECKLIQGNPPNCEYFMEGACIMVCNSELEIKIHNKSKLDSCLSSSSPQIQAEIPSPKEDFEKSKCLFFNGEGLELELEE